MIIDAWVLHKRWSGNTSAYVTFFTREHGVVKALCKGGRSPKKQALLQAFTPLWVTFDERFGWHYVRQLESRGGALSLDGHAFFAGLYINVIMHYVLQPFDMELRLYQAYEHTLHQLMDANNRFVIESVLRRFEWVFLTACGYQMSLTHDARSALPIIPSQTYTFIAGEGFIQADNGIIGAHIIAFAENKLDSPAVLTAAKWIMRRAIDYVLDGRCIQTRRLFLGLPELPG